MDTRIQSYESAEVDGFVDYVVPEDVEIARFGDNHFGTIAKHYVSLREGRSFDRHSVWDHKKDRQDLHEW